MLLKKNSKNNHSVFAGPARSRISQDTGRARGRVRIGIEEHQQQRFLKKKAPLRLATEGGLKSKLG